MAVALGDLLEWSKSKMMISKASSFYDSINIKLSYDARCGNQNFILPVESMFNRSGEGYAGPVPQNLITHQTAASILRSRDDEKGLKVR